ncbi:MAG: helix-hairpin-helix domain-containing protein [Anaerolineales bacterium]|nr:helix-hairpin-helix domain-containing protein [Anaerolineales bacterium]
MVETNTPVDINTASLEELVKLRGIKSRLAERIIEARPFQNVDDLTRVRGISEGQLTGLRPFLIVEAVNLETSQPVAEPLQIESVELPTTDIEEEQTRAVTPVEMTPEMPSPIEVEIIPPEQIASVTVESEPEPLPEVIMEPEPEPLPKVIVSPLQEEAVRPVSPPIAESHAAPPSYITRAGAVWLALGSSAITFFLAVFFTLLLLLVINGGLHYPRMNAVNHLSEQVEALASSATTLREDLDEISTRVNALDGENGRIATIEESISGMESEIDAATATAEAADLLVQDLSSSVDDMVVTISDFETQLEDVNLAVDALLTRTGRFQQFLDGLSALLESLTLVEETP